MTNGQTYADALREIALLSQSMHVMAADIAEIRTAVAGMQRDLGEDLRQLQLEHTRRCVELQVITEKTRELEVRLQLVEKWLPVVRVVSWVGTALGASLVALVWALITGQVQLVFL